MDGQTVLSPEQIYAANLGATVGVNGNVDTNVFGYTVKNAVSGSGFVIGSNGSSSYILTNYHVIDGVSDIKVFFSDGKSYPDLTNGCSTARLPRRRVSAAGGLESYRHTQEQIAQAYLDQKAWNKMAIINVARSGIFAADRSIRDYARDIWDVPVRDLSKL